MWRSQFLKCTSLENALTSTTSKKGSKTKAFQTDPFQAPEHTAALARKTPETGRQAQPKARPGANTDTNMQQHGNNHAPKLADKMFMQNKIQNDTYAGMYMYEKANNSTYTHRNMVMTCRRTQRRPLTVCFFRGGQTILTTDSSGAQPQRTASRASLTWPPRGRPSGASHKLLAATHVKACGNVAAKRLTLCCRTFLPHGLQRPVKRP